MHSLKTLGARTGTLPALLCAAVLAACGGSNGANDEVVAGAAVDGEVNVGVKAGSIPNAAVEAVIASYGQVLVADRHTSFYRVALNPGVSVAQAVASLKHPDIAIVEPNYLAWGFAAPTDPIFVSSQYLGKLRAEMVAAWDAYGATSTTNAPIVVAVLDTGVRDTHQELNGKLDSNWSDWVTVGNTTVLDDHGHGTQLAGLIAAAGDGVVGTVGIGAWDGVRDPNFIKVMPVKVADSRNVSNHAAIANGMGWAVSHGAKIILLSLGSATPSWTLQKAVQDAYAAGVLVIAAVGNDGVSTNRYPAAYQSALNQNVISVGSVDAADKIDAANKTNYGTWVNLLAPGASVWSTGNLSDSDYAVSTGTSYAAAHVAGVAALTWSQFAPTTTHGAGRLTVDEVRKALLAGLDSYDKVGAASIGPAGGRVNPQKVLAAAANLQSHAVGSTIPGSVIFSGTSLRGGASGTGVVVFTDPVSSSTVVTLSASPSGVLTLPPQVNVLTNARYATFTVGSVAVSTPTDVTVTATHANGLTATGVIKVTPPGVARITLNPATTTGGNRVTGTVTLEGPAPQSGVNVTVTSSDAAVATFLPSGATTTVPVAAAGLSGTFVIQTAAVTARKTVTIAGTAPNSSAQAQATLTVDPVLQGVSFTPNQIRGGQSSTLKITLNGAQPADIDVQLVVTDASSAITNDPTTLTTVTIPKNTTTKNVTITTRAVPGGATVDVTAKYLGVSKGATLTINLPAISSVTTTTAPLVWWDPGVVSTGTGTVTLDATAPTTTTVYLSSNDSALAIPATVTVNAGSNRATFVATPAAVTTAATVTVSASLTSDFALKKSATFQLKPALQNMTLQSQQVTGSVKVRGTVTLAAAPPAQVLVSVASDSARATVDPSGVVTINAGQATATFDVQTVASTAAGTANISVTKNGITKSVALRIGAPTISTFIVSPTTANYGQTVTGTVTLSGGALDVTQIDPSANDTTAAPGLTPFFISSGSTQGTFTFTAGTLSAQKVVTLTVRLNGVSKTASVTIRPTPVSVSVAPDPVHGGSTAVGTVTLGTAAPTGGTRVNISAVDPASLSTTYVTVASGQRTATFNVTTHGVDADTLTTVTAATTGTGAYTATDTFTVQRARVLTTSPGTPFALSSGTASATFTIQLDALAGPGGISVTVDQAGLNLGSGAIATVTGASAIASGQSSKTLTITRSGTVTGTGGSFTVTITMVGGTSTTLTVPVDNS